MVEMSAGTCAWLWAKRGGEYRRDERGNLCLGLWAKGGGVSIVEMSVEVAWPASSDINVKQDQVRVRQYDQEL